jgi:hypothetical protein
VLSLHGVMGLEPLPAVLPSLTAIQELDTQVKLFLYAALGQLMCRCYGQVTMRSGLSCHACHHPAVFPCFPVSVRPGPGRMRSEPEGDTDNADFPWLSVVQRAG